MHLFYENMMSSFEIFVEEGKHSPPHLHKLIECIYILEGSLELGIGQDFFHMDQGGFAIVFPETIHHYQIFNPKGCKIVYILMHPEQCGKFIDLLHRMCPEDPVIPKANLHKDVVYSMQSMLDSKADKCDNSLYYGFFMVILSRCLPSYNLIDKKTVGSDEIVYRVVVYLATHFKENISLIEMAKELGYSQSMLSRVFSGVFHTNFNQYVNDLRLECAVGLLERTNETITDIWINSGFESQRTFQRVFKKRYHLTPREYRISRNDIKCNAEDRC